MWVLTREAGPAESYYALAGVVTPRPIAWVTSVDGAGRVNLAPYSFFNVFGSAPPVVVFSPGLRPDGSKKDTLRNVEETGEFVVNAAVESLADAVNASSVELPHGESEAELLGLALCPSRLVTPPSVVESPARLECKVLQVLTVGTANLVIGEVLGIYVSDAVLDGSGRVDPSKLKTIARLGGEWYCRTSDLFRLARPTR